jgi:hypothetical protein
MNKWLAFVPKNNTICSMDKTQNNVVKLFGGIRAMSRKGKEHGYKWPVSTVQYWNKEGVSRKRAPEVLAVAAAEKIELTAEDLLAS